MNWDAIGAIGEIAGAFAVFVSLGYLAIQLRRSNIATQHASQNAFVADYNRLLEQLYTNSELVDLVQKATHGLEALTKNEQGRFHAFAASQNLATFNVYLQLRANQFDPKLAEVLIRFFATVLKTPGMAEWWTTQKGFWDQNYVEHLDSLVDDRDLPSLDEAQAWFKPDEI